MRWKKKKRKNRKPARPPESTCKPTLSFETIEPRILLSATWIDGTDADDNLLDEPTLADGLDILATSDAVEDLAGTDIVPGGAADDTRDGGSGTDTTDAITVDEASEVTRRELVFVDSTVPDYQTLLDGP